MSDWIEEGEMAPDFTLADDKGDKVKLSALRRPVVVYFYPKDDTPGGARSLFLP